MKHYEEIIISLYDLGFEFYHLINGIPFIRRKGQRKPQRYEVSICYRNGHLCYDINLASPEIDKRQLRRIRNSDYNFVTLYADGKSIHIVLRDSKHHPWCSDTNSVIIVKEKKGLSYGERI